MGGLSMNPEYDGGTRPKLATQIAEKEDWKRDPEEASQIDLENPEPRPVKKMRIGSFEFDSSYLTTMPGIIRIVQVIALLLGFIFVLIPAKWPDQGSYSFFCIFLVLGVLISSYLLITLIGGFREKSFCGVSWFTLELGYFISFGALIFLGSCLAANKSTSALLTLSAILGFVATVTFVYCSWTAWKSRKEYLRKLQEENEVEDEKEEPEIDSESVQKSNFDIEQETKILEKTGRNDSLPANLKDQLYQNQIRLQENEKTGRRYSASDKDSAYSEGTITPTKGKYPHDKIRRSTSVNDVEQEFDRYRKQSFRHHNCGEPMGRGRCRKSIKNRTGYNYPRELSTNNFEAEASLNPSAPKFEEDDLGRQRSMPDWLRAALGTEVEPSDHVIDDESEAALPRALRVSTLPYYSPKEFPLLAHSDEESINYPSVSQNLVGRQFRTMPFNGGDRYHRSSHEKRRRRHHHHHHHHHHGKRLYNNKHHHGHRRLHQPRRPAHHKEGGRRPINDAHEDYLRRMVENDELVANDQPSGKSLTHSHRSRRSEKKRVFPERTTSIQFPEQSRWDDDSKFQGVQNQMVEKYLQDTQNMRH